MRMPKDRGSIKWSSLMLPEHVERLKEMWQADGKMKKPTLDEQQAELLNDQLREAFEWQWPVWLHIYENGSVTELSGTVKKLDRHTKSATVKTMARPDTTIAFQDILQITFQ
ncbi:YolD-like family protein [Lentibacillus salinarum]|uniref:YolD-like family protein n=1 Tax=Lentibacillus salinarum TaxID=446820 RepID=A0ABW3ZQ93_9BACI